MVTDPRINKTKKTIQQAFLKMVVNTPINKITVTKLVKLADINKSTFYHHYLDIYDLYDQLLKVSANKIVLQTDSFQYLIKNPNKFAQEFLFADNNETPLPETAALWNPDNLRFAPNASRTLVNEFRERFYQVGALEKDHQNDVKLEFLINGMLMMLSNPKLINPKSEDDQKLIISFISKTIESIF